MNGSRIVPGLVICVCDKVSQFQIARALYIVLCVCVCELRPCQSVADDDDTNAGDLSAVIVGSTLLTCCYLWPYRFDHSSSLRRLNFMVS